ncbi:hypothetical protein GL213_06705 [Halogeometricum borinquense]|uniref:Uncharacterized protein n=1 Tax=Halogeometricum borinquense (strain ATCC 700274 / DSM 11551 / JCM 10706 / KCTC 4070 / PR3) TaxID=469382 RepID=E4NSD8_HALBP|nr:hypothetical protein [Halogeometricum borinquense]ADQ66927.1 hypothetical protein Hbor_13450 [Halogeometricum borinquense DSM 11551]ELY30433.1 hypothetical protein C499_04168 [Halogeometricum borinquense DSM 11551]QIQ76236.1 hypothetical protein GL213_06705 [Halogeometricum borinquense]
MTRHIDTFIDDSKSVDELRRAKVNRTDERGAVGVPVFLTAEELEQQGIDPEETDEVLLRVEDGFLLLDHVDPDE